MAALAGVGHVSQGQLERALSVLGSGEMAPIVDMVLFSPEPGTYEARALDGSARFRRTQGGDGWRYEIVAVVGANPLSDQDPGHLSPLVDELAVPQPDRRQNSYPLAFERIAQIWDHPCAPDLCVLHTPAHRPTAHRGEHGSLDVVQSRAPFVAAGAGIRAQGLVPGHCSLVDLAPTVLGLLGASPDPGSGPGSGPERSAPRYLARQDGAPLVDLLGDGARADHVVVVLLDGANANVVYAAAMDGTMPNLGQLVRSGTALAHGAVASLPTVTVPNHTTLLTGAHPGHHGVLHNSWFDRSLGRRVVTESPDAWPGAMQWLAPGVETIHEAVHRRQPGAVTVSVNEVADRGATWSTMDLFRQGEVARLAEAIPPRLPFADPGWMAASATYRKWTAVDTSAVQQAAGIWSGEHLGTRFTAAPAFTWVSLSLTDNAFHDGGPHSEIGQAALRDSDARLGALLEAVERRGVLERTAVFVVADHGMEETAENLPGDWGDALRSAGVSHRDESSGFLYLEPGGR